MHLPRSKIQLSPPTTLRVGARKGAGRSGSSTYARRWKLPGKGKRVRVASKGSRIHLNATLTRIHLPDPLKRSAARPFSVDDFGERLRWTGGETLVFIRTRTPTPTPLFPSTAVHHPRATRRLPLQEVCRLPFFPCPPLFFGGRFPLSLSRSLSRSLSPLMTTIGADTKGPLQERRICSALGGAGSVLPLFPSQEPILPRLEPGESENGTETVLAHGSAGRFALPCFQGNFRGQQVEGRTLRVSRRG